MCAIMCVFLARRLLQLYYRLMCFHISILCITKITPFDLSTTSEAATASANDSFQKWVVGGAVAAAGTAAAYSTTLSHAHGGHG